MAVVLVPDRQQKSSYQQAPTCGGCLHSQASFTILRINTKASEFFENSEKCLLQATSIEPFEIEYTVPEVINDTEHNQW